MKTIIGLTGVKTSGKSTAASIIKDVLGKEVEEMALADKLKNVCSEVFGIPRVFFDDQSLKEKDLENGPVKLSNYDISMVLEKYNIHYSSREIDSKYDVIGMKLKTPRKIAQIVGTEVLRKAGGEDIHCDSLDIKSKITIISDVRFGNEFDYFYNSNNLFIPLYIKRDSAEKNVTEKSHASEKDIFNFTNRCIKIDNNKGIEELKTQIHNLFKEVNIYHPGVIFK